MGQSEIQCINKGLACGRAVHLGACYFKYDQNYMMFMAEATKMLVQIIWKCIACLGDPMHVRDNEVCQVAIAV